MNAYALMESLNENKTLIVKNGVLVDGEEKEKIMGIFQGLFKKIKSKYLEREFSRYFPKEKLFYYSITSNNKDKYEREMIVYFVWDEKCEYEVIKKTADYLEVDKVYYEKILNYLNRRKKKA